MNRAPTLPALPQSSHFVGREAELQILLQHARSERLEGPGVAIISGPVGIGRTALLRRFAERLDGHLVLAVAAAAESAPFGLAGQLTEALHELSIGAVPLPRAPNRPHVLGERLLDALTGVGVGAAVRGGRPITIIIDDVQAADVESSLALGFVARRLYRERVLFVLSVRSRADSSLDGGLDPNVRRIMPIRGDVRQIRLSGLTVADIQTLAHAFGVTPLSAADAEGILRHSDGNPQYVTRLLREIRRDPYIPAQRPLVPQSVTATIARQLATLPQASRSLLSALAVLDNRCPLATAARVAGVAEPLAALEPLLAAGLVEWWPAEATTVVGIRTPLQQQAAYAATGPQLRRVLHERAATVVGFDRALAHRMLAANGNADPALAEDLSAASWRWSIEGNLERAAQYSLWAAEVLEPGAARDQRLLFGISLLQRSSRYDAATALQERARACQPSALRNCVLGRFAMVEGDMATAQRLLESAIAEVENNPFAAEFAAVAAIGYAWLALLYGWLGESGKARDTAGRCLAISPLGRRIDRGTELIYLSTCCEIDGPAATYERLNRLVELPIAPSEVDPADTMLLTLRGYFRLLLGEPAEAAADIEAAMHTSGSAGINEIDDWAHFWAAAAHAVLGSLDRAADHARAALHIAMTEGRPHLTCMLAINAYIEASTGELAAASEHASAAADIAEHFCGSADRRFPAVAAAAIARAKGDPHGVIDALGDCESWATGWLRTYRWLWWPQYIDALLDLGRIDEASAGLATMAVEITNGYRVLIVPQLYLSGRTAELRGELAAAAAAYDKAMHAAGALANPEWRARAAASYQGILARRPHCSHTDRLTARERAIAGLIADGLTNKAVSSLLGITEKTIEAHLTRVYRKLAVKSRHELQAALHAGRKAPPAVRVVACARPTPPVRGICAGLGVSRCRAWQKCGQGDGLPSSN